MSIALNSRRTEKAIRARTSQKAVRKAGIHGAPLIIILGCPIFIILFSANLLAICSRVLGSHNIRVVCIGYEFVLCVLCLSWFCFVLTLLLISEMT